MMANHSTRPSFGQVQPYTFDTFMHIINLMLDYGTKEVYNPNKKLQCLLIEVGFETTTLDLFDQNQHSGSKNA